MAMPALLCPGCLCCDTIYGCFLLFENVSFLTLGMGADELWESAIFVGKFEHSTFPFSAVLKGSGVVFLVIDSRKSVQTYLCSAIGPFQIPSLPKEKRNV